MQRSSESIAALAGALAKAQAELVNPEKSLVGTIKSGPGETSERIFRYASLSSGLDIVRKTLGQHEIATVQTTAIDQVAGMVNLTTVLAHASGEWISSDWPVCPVSETAVPHRMGAALTYARRYALFTLVGIAGEDDLDAPDLAPPTTQKLEPEKPPGSANGRLNGNLHSPPRHQAPRIAPHPYGKNLHPGEPILGPEASTETCNRLLGELRDLSSDDNASLWAHRIFPEKKRLTPADAERVEEGFRAKLKELSAIPPEMPPTQKKVEPTLTAPRPDKKGPGKRRRSQSIDKSALLFPEPRRIRDRDHVRYVARQPCLICGRQPSDAHHLRFAQGRALGRKVSDEFTVPLCRGHHREIHRCGDEAAWWRMAGIDPIINARGLWLTTHPLPKGRNALANDATIVTAAKRARPLGRRSSKNKTKPIVPAGP